MVKAEEKKCRAIRAGASPHPRFGPLNNSASPVSQQIARNGLRCPCHLLLESMGP